MVKRALIISFICLCVFITAGFSYAAEYHPPFELSGIVVAVSGDTIEVHMPYINKNVSVAVSKDTFISNRLKDKTKQCLLSEISAEDLVVIKGIVKKEVFLSTEISFLPN